MQLLADSHRISCYLTEMNCQFGGFKPLSTALWLQIDSLSVSLSSGKPVRLIVHGNQPYATDWAESNNVKKSWSNPLSDELEQVLQQVYSKGTRLNLLYIFFWISEVYYHFIMFIDLQLSTFFSFQDQRPVSIQDSWRLINRGVGHTTRISYSVMTVDDVETIDFGNYICTAKNANGETSVATLVNSFD